MDDGGLTYTIEPGEIPAIAWGDKVQVDVSEALAQMPAYERGEREEAKTWLKNFLSIGPMTAKEIFRAAKQDGISQITLRRALQELKIKKSKPGYQGKWVWSLPLFKDDHQDDQGVSTFGSPLGK